MGYESKIYAVVEHSWDDSGRMAYGDLVAVFDLCKMGYDIYNGKYFRELFDQDLTCDIYADDGNTIIKEDCYGDKLQKADFCEVLRWICKFCKENDYWRANAFKDFLLSCESQNHYLSLYHYGY